MRPQRPGPLPSRTWGGQRMGEVLDEGASTYGRWACWSRWLSSFSGGAALAHPAAKGAAKPGKVLRASSGRPGADSPFAGTAVRRRVRPGDQPDLLPRVPHDRRTRPTARSGTTTSRPRRTWTPASTCRSPVSNYQIAALTDSNGPRLLHLRRPRRERTVVTGRPGLLPGHEHRGRSSRPTSGPGTTPSGCVEPAGDGRRRDRPTRPTCWVVLAFSANGCADENSTRRGCSTRRPRRGSDGAGAGPERRPRLHHPGRAGAARSTRSAATRTTPAP